MVMMHFKWVVPIIYQWMIMAGESILWVMVIMPKEMVKRAAQKIQRALSWFYGDR